MGNPSKKKVQRQHAWNAEVNLIIASWRARLMQETKHFKSEHILSPAKLYLWRRQHLIGSKCFASSRRHFLAVVE